jgi:hypothetical protein
MEWTPFKKTFRWSSRAAIFNISLPQKNALPKLAIGKMTPGRSLALHLAVLD